MKRSEELNRFMLLFAGLGVGAIVGELVMSVNPNMAPFVGLGFIVVSGLFLFKSLNAEWEEKYGE